MGRRGRRGSARSGAEGCWCICSLTAGEATTGRHGDTARLAAGAPKAPLGPRVSAGIVCMRPLSSDSWPAAAFPYDNYWDVDPPVAASS